MKKHTFKL
ncbi:hemolysin, partial [Yersinia pestis PY-08]